MDDLGPGREEGTGNRVKGAQMSSAKNYVAILLIAALCGMVAGCRAQSPAESAKSCREAWDRFLRDRNASTDYHLVNNIDGVTRVDGYRVWRGSYGGVPIALFSCIVQQPYVFYERERGGIISMSIILGVQHPDFSVVIVSEQEHTASRLKTAEMVYTPDSPHWESMLVAAGRVKVEVKDMGDGQLGYRANVQKSDEWRSFDVQEALIQAGFKPADGPLEFLPPPPSYTVEQFCELMAERLAGRCADGRETRWFAYRTAGADEVAQVEHPLWEDPEAVRALLERLDGYPLANVIAFMDVRHSRDPFYLVRLEEAGLTPVLLNAVLSSGTPEVRDRFNSLFRNTGNWPGMGGGLELLLRTGDRELVATALKRFCRRKVKPNDMSVVRELAESDDEDVAERAKMILEADWASEGAPSGQGE
jgi:hypothetical protein